MAKVLTFRVWIDGLEDKIWRKIETTDKRTVAELAYTILASFDSLAYHMYNITYRDKQYDTMINRSEYHGILELVDATVTKLQCLDLQVNDTLIMEYDYGSTTKFIIEYLGERELEKYTGSHYPYIIDGAGRGMLDDIGDFELKEIVDDIDKKGYSDYDFTPGYKRPIKYDYRDYNIEFDNVLLKGIVLQNKIGYESNK